MSLSYDRILRFATVAEHMSFTRAAASLSMDQPWLSRQIMQLEDQLGFVLFDRNGSRISLTAEGRDFLISAQRLADAAAEVDRSADLLRRRAQSVLRVGVTYETYAVEGRQQLMSRYAAIRPNAQLDLVAYEWSEVVMEKVLSGEVDFGIALGPVPDPELEVRVVDHLDWTVAIPREDPLAARPSIALADLAGRSIAVGNRDARFAVYSHTYSWLEPVGAVAVRVPEGRRYIFDVAERERLFVLCFTPSDKAPESFVQRPIHGPTPDLTLNLIRYKRVMSPAGERLWRLAEELALDGPRAGATTPRAVDEMI